MKDARVSLLLRALLPAALCAAASAQPLEPSARQARLDETRAVLDNGLWNGRIDALYDLGETGRDGLALLAYADGDADWQVRLTAVHFLGKIGPAAAPALAEAARGEPCPHVRLFALECLSRLGSDGERRYREAATPEDEAELARRPGRYDSASMGKPLAIDAPDEMNADFFDGGADLRVCASSEHAGRLTRPSDRPRGEDAEADSHETVVTPDVPVRARGTKPGDAAREPARAGEALPPGPSAPERAAGAQAAAATPEQKKREIELDQLLAPGQPESLPAGETPPAPEGPGPKPGPRFEAGNARRLAAASVREPTAGAPESLPAGPPAPEARVSDPAPALFERDAGAGKPARDPVPGLIRQLSSPDPRRRARAADELGKRAAAAAAAVPALRRALSDPDRRARASAVLALGSAGGGVEGVADDLRRALRDKDEDVRFSAGIALERLRRAGL